MRDKSTTTIEEYRVVKTYDTSDAEARDCFQHEVEFSRALAELHLGPEVLDEGDGFITTRRGRPLTEMLDPEPHWNRWTGFALSEAIAKLHAAGFAHRDVQSGNLLVTADYKILFIDCELACRVDPKAVKPYDFYGPLSGVSPPETHAHQQIAAYWDSDTVDSPPWKWCGRLETYLL